ncbi:hypothetical protein TNCV_4158851 [Trichonephila clavipes]|nr:hypothetical protein TNCV_4158851 [Trichonephila clavipes]
MIIISGKTAPRGLVPFFEVSSTVTSLIHLRSPFFSFIILKSDSTEYVRLNLGLPRFRIPVVLNCGFFTTLSHLAFELYGSSNSSADISTGCLSQVPRSPDKLDLTRFSGYKFQSSSAKKACRSSASKTRNELSISFYLFSFVQSLRIVGGCNNLLTGKPQTLQNVLRRKRTDVTFGANWEASFANLKIHAPQVTSRKS